MKNKKRGAKIMTLILKKQSLFIMGLSFITLFLIFSYSFFLFLSVTSAHSISENKENLSRLVTKNSSLKSEYLNKKVAVVSKYKDSVVKVNNITYINSSVVGFAFNK